MSVSEPHPTMNTLCVFPPLPYSRTSPYQHLPPSLSAHSLKCADHCHPLTTVLLFATHSEALPSLPTHTVDAGRRRQAHRTPAVADGRAAPPHHQIHTPAGPDLLCLTISPSRHTHLTHSAAGRGASPTNSPGAARIQSGGPQCPAAVPPSQRAGRPLSQMAPQPRAPRQAPERSSRPL